MMDVGHFFLAIFSPCLPLVWAKIVEIWHKKEPCIGITKDIWIKTRLWLALASLCVPNDYSPKAMGEKLLLFQRDA